MKKLKWLLLAIAFLIICGGIGFIIIFYGGTFIVDDDALTLDATTTIETSEGELIGKLYEENREPVSLEDIPEQVQKAFIAIEDRRFYEHSGIDFKSVFRAAYQDILAMQKLQGGSTITQQLAKNLFLSHDKTWLRKAKELMASLYLERHLSKDKILELYLNKIYFGQGVYGIEKAAWKFYGKTAEELTLSEGALLAGMVKAPNGYSPIDHPDKAVKRRNVVLQSMIETNAISKSKGEEAKQKENDLDVQTYEPKSWAASFNDLVIKEAKDEYSLTEKELRRGGYNIETTINSDIQKIAYENFQEDDYFAGNTEGVEGAFVMLEQDTGDIAAALGGRDYKLGDMNRVTVKRQPGSVMKPLAVYGPAMMQETYRPYSIIPDRKEEIDGYSVTNYDDQYAGYVSIYEALVDSKNVPAVWLLNEIGVPYAKDYLTKLGMSIKDEGLAIGLGGLSEGVSPLNIASAYRAIGNNGITSSGTAIEKIIDRDGNVIHDSKTEGHDVFTPQVSWDITSMLQTAVEEGTGSAGSYSKALAGKTGTTQHPQINNGNKDAWFVGLTPEYVSTAWMGYDISDEKHYLTGGSEMTTKLTKDILKDVDDVEALAESFKKPEDVAALPTPIELPKGIQLKKDYSFGGTSLFKAELKWTEADDDRIVYRIYKEQEGIDERIAEVKGDNEYTLDSNSIFTSFHYYVVPYNPLTKTEGQKSNVVDI